MKRSAVVGGSFLACCLVSSSARAQTAEELALRSLTLSQAQAAAERGNAAEALELAERAGAIQMTPSVRLFLGRQLQQLGRHSEAALSAQRCLREVAAATVNNAEAIRAQCQALASEVQGFVGSILLRLPSPLPAGFTVRVAGIERTGAQQTLPILTPTGPVLVQASAPGFSPFSQRIEVSPRSNTVVEVRLAAVETASAGRPSIGPGPFVLYGVGGAFGIAALGFVLARDQSVRDNCAVQDGELRCWTAPGQDPGAPQYLLQSLSLGSALVGGASVAAATVWLAIRLTQRSAPSETEEVARWFVVPDGAGVRVGGRF